MNFLITILFIFSQSFQLSWSFWIITILFNYYIPFQLSQPDNHDFLYHNLFQSLYSFWHYLYENKPPYEFHHLTHIFYRQNMIKIFCQFHVPNLCFLRYQENCPLKSCLPENCPLWKYPPMKAYPYENYPPLPPEFFPRKKLPPVKIAPLVNYSQWNPLPTYKSYKWKKKKITKFFA